MYATTVEQALLATWCTFSSIWQGMHERSTKHHDGAISRARNTATAATAGIFFVDASGVLLTQTLAGQLHPPLDTRELGEIDVLFTVTSRSKNLILAVYLVRHSGRATSFHTAVTDASMLMQWPGWRRRRVQSFAAFVAARVYMLARITRRMIKRIKE
jgi:hypothetical protein